ncbi:TldD/PmbA family protein [Baekduia alba]|uniref:TldD/PmbA family protein n=1 Tax=Baekduia alba TaxID=2997333 RepID=UPI0032C4477B
MRALADAALERAVALGADHADVRLQRMRQQTLRLRDGALESARDGEELGLAVRVVHDGAWGFASGTTCTVAAAAELAERAVGVARLGGALSRVPAVLAPEPVHADAVWVSDYDVDPFAVPLAERVERLAQLSRRLLAADGVDHVDASLVQVLENKHYADTAGTTTTQQRVRLHPELVAIAGPASMRTLAPPAGRGWEYMTGTGWDWDAEIDALPALLREHAAAPSVEAGRYDLVIHPSNLWLTIHESIAHATELDRVLGHEAAFAGTSFATFDQLGTLRYGSPLMHVTGDRTAPHGLATVGYDDEGVAAQAFDIVRDGVLVGYQLDRQMAQTRALGRSNGCAYADSAQRAPLQRMPNVSLRPAPGGPSTEELIGRVERGIYVVGNASWSIDMQRLNFQFTGQQFHRIQDGRLAGQLRDVAYQATTTDFWASLEAVGGPETYMLCGTIACGKGQPGQAAAVSHGSPSALFRGVNVLNTRAGA